MSETRDVEGGGSTDRPMPPYEDRQKSAPVDSEQDTHKDGANVGGATGPVENTEMKSTPKEDTPRGAEASPSDEQPAAAMPEADLDDDRVGPDHYSGTGSGENKTEDKR
ncbi:MAG: hypothetical protein QOC66_3241 [Pseudonocardiales bacterium]|jgi:hypothetical protein|nr:hypothetical protein [Pseudonocardiales bacterium]